jgi:hypothetical protein
VVAWSDIYNPDSVTRAYGTFEAKGGVNGGDGGTVEVSGYNFNIDNITIKLDAPKGDAGTFLLDPYNIWIASPYQNMSQTHDGVTNTLTYSGTTGDSRMDASTLSASLSNYNITLYAQSIIVTQTIEWSGSNTLKLDVDSPISIQGSSRIISGYGTLIINSRTNSSNSAYNIIESQNTDNVIASNIYFTGGYGIVNVGLTGDRLYLENFYGSFAKPSTIAQFVNINNNSNVKINSSVSSTIFGSTAYTIVDSGSTLTIDTPTTINVGLQGTGNVVLNSTLSLNPSGGFQNFSGVISGSGGVTYNGYGTTLNGANTYTGASNIYGYVYLNNYNAMSSSSAVNLYNGASLGIGTSAAIKNLTANSGSTLNLNAALLTTQSINSQMDGLLSGYGALTINNSGAAHTLTLNNNSNTHSGNVSIGSGMTVAMGYGNVLGTSGTVYVPSGATLQLNSGASTNSGKSLYLSGGTITGYGTIGGAVTLGANTILEPSNYLNFNGSITGGYDLTIYNTYATTFNGTVSGLASLTSDGLGSTVINANISTIGAQNYNAVSVTGARTLTSNSGVLNFNHNLTGNNALTLVGNASGLTVLGNVNIGANALTLKGTTSGTGTLNIGDATFSASGLAFQNFEQIIANDQSRFTGVSTLAASGIGSLFVYSSNGALTLGTVNGINGISTTGNIAISTDTGNLTITQGVSTTNASEEAILLGAGDSMQNGATSDGNIIRSGSGAISVGVGGTAKLYTGSIADSTGLVGYSTLTSGSGRFRYNSSQANTGYTKELATGLNLIYREQPTLSAQVSSASKTYDGQVYSETPSLTYSGFVNGDTAGDDITINSSTIVGDGLTAVNAGSYGIGATLDINNTLGYANPTTATEGTLTINKRALSLSGTKVYDSTTDIDASKLTTFTNLVGSETVTLSGTGTVANKNVANGKTLTVGTLALGDGTNGGLANNYILTGGTHTIDITKADISSIGGITASNKVYDGTTTATLTTSGAVFNGIIGSDDLTVATSTGNFSDKNVADGKTVNITALTLGGTDVGNYNLVDTTASTTANITPRAITLSSVTADNREYNGIADTSASVSAWGAFNNIIEADVSKVSIDTANIVANFDNGNVGTAKNVNISGIALSGDEASNYSIVNTFLTTANITPKTLGIAFDTAPTKVYDGTINITGGGNLSLTGIINSEDVSLNMSGATYTYADKNVGINKSLIFDGVTLVGGQGGNYQLNLANVPTNATITRLDTITWTGGGSTNSWFDAANWAGGAVPDLSNVANVVIPEGVTISFDTVGATAGVSINAVNIDTLGSLGSLNMSNGILNVSDSMELNTLTQSGGTIGGATNVNLQTLNQSGGTISNIGNLVVSNSFTQSSTAGSIAVGGDVSITQTNGDLILGNIANSGNLNVNAIIGNISQLTNATLSPIGLASFTASGNIDLTNDNNDFTTLALSGADVSFKDSIGGVTLGNITTTGIFSAVSSDGNISQTNDSVLDITGVATLDAGTDNVNLANANNDFKNTVNVTAAGDVILADANGIELGNITTTGTLGVNAVDNITQKTGTGIATGGNISLASTSGDITLTSATNEFGGSFSADANDITLSNYAHALTLGDIISSDVLSITTSNQAITQAVGSTLVSNGTATLNSGNANINLTNDNNDFTTLALSGADVSFKDSIGGVTLGNITTTGIFSAVSSDGNISQTNDSVLDITGVATLDAGTDNVNLANANNDFKNTVNVTAAGDVILADANGIELGNITTTGTLGVNAVDNITQKTGTGITTGGNISLASTSGDITLTSASNEFGGSFSADANDITLSNYAHALTLGDIISSDVLSITTSNQAITQAVGSTLVSNGTATLNSGNANINLTNDNNDFTTLALSGADVSFKDSIGGVTLGNITTTGIFSAVNTVDGITQGTGTSMTIGSDAIFDVGTNDFTLANIGNNFGALGITAHNIDISNITGDLTLANMQATGTLDVNIVDNILQKVGTIIEVAGESTLSTSTGDIILDGTNNDFSTIYASGKDVILADANGIELGNITTTGTLGVNAVDNITQKTGTGITTGGNISLASTSGDITLTSASNEFGGSFSADANDITLSNYAHALTLGDIISSDVLSITTSNQAITQAVGSTLVSNGTATLNSGNANINLTNDNNDFTTLALSGADVSFKDSIGGVTLGNITTTGIFSAVSSDGNISQTNDSVLDITGVATLDAGTDNVNLANANNDFKNTVNVTAAGDVILADANGIELGNITTTGTLGVNAVDNITQKTGTGITTGGNISLASTSGDITLTSATNEFGGSFGASGNNIALTNYNYPLSLGNIVSNSSLSIVTNDAPVTQAVGAKLTLKGISSIEAGTSSINLGNKGNDYKALTLVGGSITKAETIQEEAQRLEEERLLAASNTMSSSNITNNLAKDIKSVETSVMKLSLSPDASKNSLSSPNTPTNQSNTTQTFSSFVKQTFNLDNTQKISIFSIPSKEDEVQKITYSELLTMIQNSQQIQSTQTSESKEQVKLELSELKIPVTENLMIQLVGNGIYLPEGLEQEFYITRDFLAQ